MLLAQKIMVIGEIVMGLLCLVMVFTRIIRTGPGSGFKGITPRFRLTNYTLGVISVFMIIQGAVRLWLNSRAFPH